MEPLSDVTATLLFDFLEVRSTIITQESASGPLYDMTNRQIETNGEH